MKINTAGNGVFYYDFDAERSIAGWELKRREGKCSCLATVFETVKSGRFTLVFHDQHGDIKWLDFKVDGKLFPFNWGISEIAYVAEKGSNSGITYAFKIDLEAGIHPLELNLTTRAENVLGAVRVALLSEPAPEIKIPQKADRVIRTAPPAQIAEEQAPRSPDLKGFKPGIGTEPCAGRFGFTKGDGILDCGMPVLGIIDKLYPCGHPDYNKPYKWTISLLPPGIDPNKAYHGSCEPAQVGLENDQVTVNHLTVNWKAAFDSVAGFFERKAGAKIDFACTYSLGSPGIFVESSDPGIALSMLETAGNYQYVLVPQNEGIRCSALGSDFIFDGQMSENWMLLCGATEFPDIPILLVFEKAPAGIKVERAINGRLKSLTFHLPPKDAKMFVATPFGIECLSPKSSADDVFITDAVGRGRFWSRAFLAYPVKCKEYYKLDKDAEKVEVIQKFDYRLIKDQWHTKPLKTAPLPPTLAMLDGTDIVEFDADIRDFKFPTKYGYLKGAVGRNFSSYKIPYMPRERKFPLKDSNDNTISGLLAEDLKAYFEFHGQFKDTQQAYPYAGSAMEPYAWSSSLFNFMDQESRQTLAAKCSERLKTACNPDWRFTYPIINFDEFMREMPGPDRVMEIYRDPNMRYIDLYNWYQRQEPFTGAKYKLCYINLCLIAGGGITKGTREEVAAIKEPLIENDWGMGLTFYYMYLCALTSGSFKPIRENWTTLCDAMKYFEALHDWACMGTGVCDNGRGWVEGANYGAFTAFVNMAEAIGEQDSRAKGIYIAAKQLILRLAIFRSAEKYFCRFFNHSPWYITKSFREEDTFNNGYAHVPFLLDGSKFTGIYNLTTEGLYPEFFRALLKFLPDEWAKTREIAISAFTHAMATYNPNQGITLWGTAQGVSSCLIAAALDEDFDRERLLREIQETENRGHLIKEWRGIHIYSRLLPKNYFKCQLLAWLANREHPAWLEHWVNVEIATAEYDRQKQKAVIAFKLLAEKGMMRLGTRTAPAEVLLDGKKIKSNMTNKSQLTIELSHSGTLELSFH